MKLPPVATIKKLLEHGYTAPEIASDYGVTERAVHQKLKRNGIDIDTITHSKKEHKRKKLPSDEVLIKLIQQGKTDAEIAKLYECSRQAVSALTIKYRRKRK